VSVPSRRGPVLDVSATFAWPQLFTPTGDPRRPVVTSTSGNRLPDSYIDSRFPDERVHPGDFIVGLAARAYIYL
jgi:hypothetical protein